MVKSASHDQLAAQIAARSPRVVTLWGPAGYDKHAFVRAYGARIGAVIACDLDRRRDRDLARPVLDAIVVRDRSRAARSAADRLALRRDLPFGTAREALRREWPRADGPELLVLRDATGAFSTPAGADLLAELIATLPAERTIALTTRTPLPPGLEHLIERERARTVEPRELALTLDAVRDVAHGVGLAAGFADRIHALTEGWPLLTRLLFVLAECKDIDGLLREMSGLQRHALLAYASHRVVAALDERLRETLAAAAVRPGATAADLVRVLDDRCDDSLLFQLWNLPFVTLDDERTYVHPELTAVLRSRFTPLVESLYERTLRALVEDGAHAAAARVALENRDAERAAALLDAAPPYTTAGLALADYERVFDRIDRDLITRYPSMWMATIAFRRFAVDRETYVREAETIYFCMPYSAPPDKRAAALMHLASAYFNLGRIPDCDVLLESALNGFAAEPNAVRASLLGFAASLRGEQGLFSRAKDLAREAGEISHHDFAENLVLHHIEATEAVARGRYDRVHVIFDELLRRHSHDELPLYFAYAACDAAFWAWAFGDDARFAHYISTLEGALTPGLEPGFARMIDAAHGHTIGTDDAYAWPIHAAIAQFYRFGHASEPSEILAAARAAAHAADYRGDPMLQAFAHTALYIIDDVAREPSRARLLRIARQVESPELRAAIDGVIAGHGFGLLAPFVEKKVLRQRQRRSPVLSVELLSAHVLRDGVPVNVSPKELQLLALLASAYGPVSTDRIGEALWDHLEPENWPNNLKVTLSRLTKKLDAGEVVVSDGGNNRLSRAVDVDVRRYESVVRAASEGPLDDTTRASLTDILEAYASGSAGRYDRFPWMQPVVARMKDLICTAGLTLARDSMQAQMPDDALGYAAIVTGVEPYNEQACELTMQIRLRRGDLDAARREYRRYATALATDLGAEPSQRLVELLREAR